jgi:ribonuclease BN (tRNA processing enzyme)
VRITVLGKSPSWQDAGGACSGYLVEEAGTVVLLDCGNGVFGKLREHVDYVDVDAVVLSHLHADHFLDLVPYSYALTYAPRQQPVPVHRWPGTGNPARPRLLCPRGGRDVFRRVTGAWGSETLIEDAFDLCEYDPHEFLKIGPLTVRFHAVVHFVPAWAVEIVSSATGGRFTFGADSAPTEELVRFADRTDLLMLEATLPRPERTGMRGHLTPGEAGDHAARANAKQLVVTHFSDELDAQWVRAEAERAFGRAVHVACEGDSFTL